MAAKDLQPVKVCPTCKRTMVAKHSWCTGNRRGAQTYWHDARSGLCRACSQKIQRAAERVAHPAAPRPKRPFVTKDETEGILDDYDMIRDSVSHIRDAAKRMGLKESRLSAILYRARRRKDPRGRPPLEQLERAIDVGSPYGRTHRHSIDREEAA